MKESEEEDELEWNDVFPEDAPQLEKSDSDESAEESVGEEQTEDVGDDHTDGEDIPVEKEVRMTTNKRKAANFYTNTNVKNKNRNKAALLRALTASARTVKPRKRR